jgi:hypothetical protein
MRRIEHSCDSWVLLCTTCSMLWIMDISRSICLLVITIHPLPWLLMVCGNWNIAWRQSGLHPSWKKHLNSCNSAAWPAVLVAADISSVSNEPFCGEQGTFFVVWLTRYIVKNWHSSVSVEPSLIKYSFDCLMVFPGVNYVSSRKHSLHYS